MHRIPNYQYGSLISESLSRLPQGMRDRLTHVRWFCGSDPIFAGLHSYEDTTDARSYRNTSHCLYPYHINGPADRRVTTIVIPELETPDVLVHELGHALDGTINFDHLAIQPVTWYAKTNQHEAFAEALVAYTHYYGDREVAETDYSTLRLFEELS